MNLNDLKASGQAKDVIPTSMDQHSDIIKVGSISQQEEEHEEIIKVGEPVQSEKKVVSISDMVKAGAVKQTDYTERNKGELDKIVEDVFAPNALDESLARRKAQIDEMKEKEFYESELGDISDAEDSIPDTETSVDASYPTDDIEEDDFDPDFDGSYEEDVLSDNTDYVYQEPIKYEEEKEEVIKEEHKEMAEVTLSEVKEENHVNVGLDTPKEETPNTAIGKARSNFEKISDSNEGIKNIDFEEELKKLDSDNVTDSVDEDTDEETFNKLKELLSDKMKVNRHNLEGFTVVKRPVSLSNALALTKDEEITKTVDWVLYNTGVPVSMRTFSGAELEAMNNATMSRNRSNSIKEIYGRIYNHITSPKPATYEEWLKSVSYFDVDHLFFAVYRANFEGVNFLPYTCEDEKCKHVFLTDNTDIMKMVKFENDDVKKRFYEIYESKEYNPDGLFAEKIVPISEHYAVGIKEASIYSILIEQNISDRDFMTKYSNTLNILPYIGGFYTIDYNTRSYQPVAFKNFANNPDKTIRSKVITYSAIMAKLTSDEYSNLIGLVGNIANKSDNISYVMPEEVCPKCGATIESSPAQAADMVFTRHRLGTAQSI